VEDDRELAEYVRKGLEEKGYVVQVCVDESAGLKAAEL
jgi:DNA-binding response OmpR family regulator